MHCHITALTKYDLIGWLAVALRAYGAQGVIIGPVERMNNADHSKRLAGV